MNPIDKLIDIFEKFPGIGPRQARRFVHFLLTQRQGYRGELADSIKKLGAEVQQCKMCYRWFVRNDNKIDTCGICSNTMRHRDIIFVVEKDADIDNIERSGYRGLYFVLGGTIPLAAEEPEKFIRIRELVKRVESDASEKKLKEIILGLSATTEGDHTRLLLQEKILPIAGEHTLKLSSLGRGLSTGSELEYADPDTIANALNSRA